MNQLLLVVGAFALLGGLMVPIYRGEIYREQILIASEATMAATAIGQEIMEEITARRFDAKVTGTATDSVLKIPDSLTAPNKLGIESGGTDTLGSMTSYDDLDDFNGYHGVVSTPRFGNFYDSCKVYYVPEDFPDIKASYRTSVKRIEVKVYNPYLYSFLNPTTKDTSLTILKTVSYRWRR